MAIMPEKKSPFSKVGSAKFPELQQEFPHTSKGKMDEALKILRSNEKKWIENSPEERIVFLDEINRDLLRISDRWIDASLRAKGISPHSTCEGEEWIVLAIAFRTVRLLRSSLQNIKKENKLQYSDKKNGQVVVKVFPQNWIDRLLFKGISGEVWMKPGLTQEMIAANRAKSYKSKNGSGSVCLVLAAGNVAVLAVMDSLNKLFVKNQTVLLKTNPVNAYLGPLYEECF